MLKSSGLLTIADATKIIYKGHCRLRGVSFSEIANKTSTITVYNSLSAVEETEVAYGMAAGGATTSGQGATNFVIKFSKEDNLDCETGLFAALSETSTGSFIIYYEIL